MKKINKKIDIFFLLLMILIFVIITYVFLTNKELGLNQYILLGLNFIIIVIAYYTSVVLGLLNSALIIFIYGSYILYQNIILNNTSNFNNHIWIIIFPISGYIAGKLGDYTRRLGIKIEEFEDQIKKLVTIDEITGLNNIKEFVRDLEEEVSRERRHSSGLVLMLIEIQYFDELIGVYGKIKANEISKIMARIIKKVTRNEDKRYKVHKDMFAIIMPNTDVKGAKIVKARLKQELENIIIRDGQQTEELKFDIKVGYLKYNSKIRNPFEFKELVEKELEFDV